MIYILFSISLFVIPFLLVDFYYNFRKWYYRIHCGRWNDLQQWKAKVGHVCEKWLASAPVVRKRDENRLILWDMLRGNFSSNEIQSWQLAGLVIGLSEYKVEIPWKKIAYRITNGKNVEIALLAYSVLKNVDDPSVYKKEMDKVYHIILRIKGDEKTVPYREGMQNIRFVDTLGFICPFLVMYGKRYGDAEAIQLAEQQFFEYDQACLPSFGFPAHAYDLEKKVPLGIYDWGRGVGWYILALVEMHSALESTELKDKLACRILFLANSIIEWQLPEGGFAAHFFSGGFSEGSSTVLIGILLNRAYVISKKALYLSSLSRVMAQLMKMTQRNGCLDMCQGDTKGIGVYSTEYGYMPFAQGLLLKLINDYTLLMELGK